MGREIAHVFVDGLVDEWWIVSTTCQYGSRVSKPFNDLDELFGTLEKGGLDQSVIDTLKEGHLVLSMEFGRNGVRSFSREVDEALHKADASCPTGSESLYVDASVVGKGCSICEKDTMILWQDAMLIEGGKESKTTPIICVDCE
jgi:hypothetical protein